MNLWCGTVITGFKWQYQPSPYVEDDDVIKRIHFPRYWSFLRGVHRPVDSPRHGQWHGALILSLICAWTKCWANNRHPCVFKRHRADYDVTVMADVNHDYMEVMPFPFFCQIGFSYIPWITDKQVYRQWHWPHCKGHRTASTVLCIPRKASKMG